jgi:Ca2+:H+ antiporter
VKFSKSSAIYFLLIFAPISVALDLASADHLVLFVLAALALVPLAKLIGDSTEHLSFHYGATTGSLLNVTFGNAAEIIIALVAIQAGLFDLVKASITGSILGNILLVFGLSIVAAGIKYKEQKFNVESVGIQSSMLFLAIIGLAVPTLLSITVLSQPENISKVQQLSDALAIVLLVVYILGIVFTAFTHKYLFAPIAQEEEVADNQLWWSKRKALVLLGVSMVGVVATSEILVNSVESTGKELGFGELFIGAVIVGIVGNAAEHSGAIMLARKGKIEISIGIAAGSGTQVALFVVPILVIAGIAMAKPFTLVFTLYELTAMFLSAIILNLMVHDGKSNWFEGVMLTAVYLVIAIGFFFIG